MARAMKQAAWSTAVGEVDDAVALRGSKRVVARHVSPLEVRVDVGNEYGRDLVAGWWQTTWLWCRWHRLLPWLLLSCDCSQKC
jgi:hypothetical protein